MQTEEETTALPPKEEFSAWYNDLLWRAEIMDVRYPVKGVYVWYPFGFSIRKLTYAILRQLLDKDHQETLFPLLIPENEFMKEAEHIKGFEEEVYWVTHGGLTELDVKLALRPTSETAIYPMYALWVRSHADLPLKLYQIVNTFRYETKHTRPLIRLREITSFKEAHTVHATWDEAAAQVEDALALYTTFYQHLCVPILISRRPEWDKFPGADYTMAVDTVMPDGRTLQIGTVHHLGDHFSRTFDITYENQNGEQQLAYQTCYGISERCIAALISMHGDDNGLILPPELAPVQVVVVPIIVGKRRDEVLAAARTIRDQLEAAGLRVKLDEREIRPGAKYYHWEMRGVPLRVELGPRDIDNGVVTAVTRKKEKSTIPAASLVEGVQALLEQVRNTLVTTSDQHLASHMNLVETMDDLKSAIEEGVAIVHWCGEKACADRIEEQIDASVLGTEVRSPLVTKTEGRCLVCGRAGTTTLIGRSY
ncbi:proline--tRNA ligase [Methanosphaerula subterraneus]|uniref:proline--tRNA ligase n=1 Tax=Methanosphaerula subterraneus TaxID=3350244 RepID=UPI003F856B2D